VPRVSYNKIAASSTGERSENVRKRVAAARAVQERRFLGATTMVNAEMGLREIERYCYVDPAGQALLRDAVDKLSFSARTYHRIIKIARTVADLDSSESISTQHVAEALQYRPQVI